MHIDKAAIVAILRSRGLKERADWVDRELPSLVDTSSNAALLAMLHIDPATIPAADISGAGEATESADRDRRSNHG
jgi:hypothetical protein